MMEGPCSISVGKDHQPHGLSDGIQLPVPAGFSNAADHPIGLSPCAGYILAAAQLNHVSQKTSMGDSCLFLQRIHVCRITDRLGDEQGRPEGSRGHASGARFKNIATGIQGLVADRRGGLEIDGLLSYELKRIEILVRLWVFSRSLLSRSTHGGIERLAAVRA